MEKHRHLIESRWDRDFIENDTFRNWFENQIADFPILPGQLLVDYVRTRIQDQKPIPQQQQQQQQQQQRQPQVHQFKPPPPAPRPSNPIVMALTSSSLNGEPVSGDQDDAGLSLFDMNSYAPGESDSTIPFDPTPSPLEPMASSSSSALLADLVPASTNYHDFSQATTQEQQQQTYFAQQRQLQEQRNRMATMNPQEMGVAPLSVDPSMFTVAPALISGRSGALNPSTIAAKGTSSRIATEKTKKQIPVVAIPALPISAPVSKSTSSSSTTKKATPSSSTTPKPRPIASSSASSSVLPPPPPAANSPLQDWATVSPTLQDLLSLSRFSKSPLATCSRLLQILSAFNTTPSSTAGTFPDTSTIPLAGRIDVLKALLEFCGSANEATRTEFWEAWFRRGNEGGMEAVQSWFWGATASGKKSETAGNAKDEAARAQCLVLVLKLFQKMPWNSDRLKQWKVGARLKRLVTSPEPQLAKLAKSLMDDWMLLTSKGASGAGDGKPDPDSKRKAADIAGAAKKKSKVDPSSSTSKASLKAAPTASLPAKVALPSFKKEKKPDVAPAVASPAPEDPFQMALQAVSRPRTKVVNPVKGVLPTAMAALAAASRGKGKEVKKTKKVHWPTDEELVKVRFIEKAIYEGDGEGRHRIQLDQEDDTREAFKLMENQEGLTLSQHMEDEMEEEVAWYQPVEVEVPLDADFDPFRTPPDSRELSLASEQELYAMSIDAAPTPPRAIRTSTSTTSDGASDSSSSDDEDDLPSTPASPPPSTAFELEPAPAVVTMLLSKELTDDVTFQEAISRAQSTSSPLGGFAQNDQITALLAQLGNNSSTTAGTEPWQQQAEPYQTREQRSAMAELERYPTELIQSILESTPALAQLQDQLGRAGMLNSGGNIDGGGGQLAYGQPPNYALQANNWNNATPSVISAWDRPAHQPGEWPPRAPSNPNLNPNPYGYEDKKTRKRGALLKGRKPKSSEVCKFFASRTGCDWGNKCRNIHDKGDGRGDVREQ